MGDKMKVGDNRKLVEVGKKAREHLHYGDKKSRELGLTD